MQQQVLEHCRRHGIWIVADDVYTRLYRHGRHAPSFLSIAEPEVALISVNSFSKCWSMTGWAIRLDRGSRRIRGEAGPADGIQHVPATAGFVQEAGIAAPAGRGR